METFTGKRFKITFKWIALSVMVLDLVFAHSKNNIIYMVAKLKLNYGSMVKYST